MESTVIKIEGFELNELYKSFPGVIISIKVNLDFTEECLFISDNCETYFGYTADELIKDWAFFLNNVNGQDKDYFKTDMQTALKTTKRIAAEGRFRTKNNEIKWLKFNANIIDNKTHYILQGVYIDITEEKTRDLKEEKLKDSLILLARNSVIYNGDILSVGKLCTLLITETLETSRSSFWLYKEDSITCDKLFTKSTEQFSSGMILNQKDYPEFFTAISKEPYILANDAKNYSSTKCLTEGYLNQNAICSLLAVPIIHNQTIIGVLIQEQNQQQRQWKKQEVNFLFQVAELVSLCFSLNERTILEATQQNTIDELNEEVKSLKYQLLK